MKQSKPKKERPEYRFGSNVSLNSSIPARHLGAQVPQELSLEKVQSKDGFIINYLRVYCERVRQGDHFKTIRVHGGSTARKCLKELVDIYYTKIGAPEQFQLFEVFGRIAPVNGIGDNNETVLAFTEVKCRPIPPEETIHDLFSSTAPGSGLSRRIELRSCQHPFVQPSTMSRSSHTSSNDIPATPTTPPLRRSVTPGGSRMTFRDSRRKRVPRVTHPPDGPYFLMLRGSQPQKDSLIYDLSSLVQKNSTRSEITIGSRPSADICIHSAPGETLPQREQITFAKLVGYDQPLTVDGTNILTGAIYLEPALSEWNTEGKTPLDIPYIAVNDEILVQPNSPFFKPRLLRPGDLVYFGSTNRGYVFLFKDPRWIPDHRLVLGLPAPKAGSVVENHGPRINGYSVNLVEQVRYAEKSSDTDSSNSLQALGKKTLSELIPRSVYLRQVISNLFTQPISVMTSRHAANDPFGASNWSRIDPWRSAGLFAHLIRSTAHFVITPNPAAPNTDIDQLNPHAIQDYAINRLKDMHALLLECHQTVFAVSVTSSSSYTVSILITVNESFLAVSVCVIQLFHTVHIFTVLFHSSLLYRCNEIPPLRHFIRCVLMVLTTL
ncbi:unnamed protein product [Dicrocoelium dendriticum]|nr:unnamed protein product [Dicrocoelium dendriticum]